MATTVLEIIPGQLKHGEFTVNDLRPIEISGDLEAKVLAEMAAWTIVKAEETTLSHEDMGDYDYGGETKRTALVEMPEKCIVRDGQLYGVVYEGIIFFTDGRQPIGEASYSSDYDEGRSTYYTKTNISLIREKGVTVLDGVVYQEKDGNPYYYVHCIPRALCHAVLHPDTVDIQASACEENKNLETIVFSPKLKYVSMRAFKGCTALKKIHLPASLKSISEEAFAECTALTTVTIEEGLTGIGTKAFCKCFALSEIHIPASVKGISSAAFQFCQHLKTVVLPNQLTEISSDTFKYCYALENIKLPEQLTYIEQGAFLDCYRIRSLALPGCLKYFHWSAISGCDNLVEIITDFPEDISKKIGETQGIAIHKGDSWLRYKDGFVFLCGDTTTLVGYEGEAKEITLPDTYQGQPYTIRQHAFRRTGVTAITTPESMTSLPPYAFARCSTLEKVILPAGMTEIPEGLMQWCENLESVNLPQGLVSIGKKAFEGCGLKTLSLPDSVKTLGDSAFSYCKELKDLHIGKGVESISLACFSGCKSLVSVVISEGVKKIDTVAFKQCESLSHVELPSTIETMGHSVFEECHGLKELPKGLRIITDYMFQECKGLEAADIPEGVKEVGYRAFADCPKLRTLHIPASLRKIKGKAFLNCSRLTEVHIAPQSPWARSFGDPLAAGNYFRRYHDTEKTMGC